MLSLAAAALLSPEAAAPAPERRAPRRRHSASRSRGRRAVPVPGRRRLPRRGQPARLRATSRTCSRSSCPEPPRRHARPSACLAIRGVSVMIASTPSRGEAHDLRRVVHRPDVERRARAPRARADGSGGERLAERREVRVQRPVAVVVRDLERGERQRVHHDEVAGRDPRGRGRGPGRSSGGGTTRPAPSRSRSRAWTSSDHGAGGPVVGVEVRVVGRVLDLDVDEHPGADVEDLVQGRDRRDGGPDLGRGRARRGSRTRRRPRRGGRRAPRRRSGGRPARPRPPPVPGPPRTPRVCSRPRPAVRPRWPSTRGGGLGTVTGRSVRQRFRPRTKAQVRPLATRSSSLVG